MPSRTRCHAWLLPAVMLAGLLLAAQAGKSYYRLTISNDTPDQVWIQLSNSGCTDWKLSPTNNPDDKVQLAPATVAHYEWVRASRCSGLDGQVPVQVWQGFDTYYAGSVAFDYTADHEASWSVDQPGDRLFHVTFTPYSDPSRDLDDLTIDIISTRRAGIYAAMVTGCLGDDVRKAAVQSLSSYSDVGALTRQKANAYSLTPFKVTNLKVTMPIWGFRALTAGPDELVDMQQGYLLSKMSKYMNAASPDQRALGWFRWGPRVEGPNDAAALGMRHLAVDFSDVPRSQFCSVAIDFETAASFLENPATDYVYAFQVIPDSEIFGLDKCALAGGEKQVQVLGATPIYDLMRKMKEGDTWEAWTGSTTGWVASTVTPSND